MESAQCGRSVSPHPKRLLRWLGIFYAALCPSFAFAEVIWERTEEVRSVLDVVDEVDVAFPYINHSDTPLAFQTLEADCPCVVLKAEPEITPPGQKGMIRARIDLRPYKGDSRKLIRATTAGVSKDLVVSIQVTPAVKITPRVVWWTDDEHQDRVVTLTLANPDVKITDISSDTPSVPHRLTPKSELEWNLTIGRFTNLKDAMAKLTVTYEVSGSTSNGSVVAIIK